MKKIFFASLALSLALVGCSQDPVDLSAKADIPTTQEESASSEIRRGILRVKLTPQVGDNLTVTTSASGLRSGNDAMDSYLHSVGAHRMTRVFPHAGKYEARTRKSGLHLWYDVEFNDEISPLRAARDLEALPGVSIVEKLYHPVLPKSVSQVVSLRSGSTTRTTSFNDPILPYQWHYNNEGTSQRSVQGADINLYEAWKIETGKPSVIVAVVDGGVDINHEDLKESMHVNEAELNGTAGVDDDDNGYVDDVYGYNFVDKNGAITPHKHGTHVAGTVGARNNNGKGVGGVAGGDGSATSGVRMISCQTFAHSTTGGADLSADGAPAIKYGADAGAVISQNSWGYSYPGPGAISASMADAIDYFIEYAGCDENGNQRADSPMKGGIVIFAAGNDYMDYRAYPAAYEKVVSVGAFGPDFKLSDYSNRGDWVSILAPGGNDWIADGEVISTFPNNQYSYMVGTSMACPHVSGIAALVVSEYGKQGFTAEDLKSRLVNAVKDRDVNAENPTTRGRMGRGYIDAVEALKPRGNKAPNPVQEVQVDESMTGLKITFKTVADEDDEKAISYKIFASTSALSASNLSSASYTKEIYTHFTPLGTEVSHSLANLGLDTKYYFAIQAEDRWGNVSAPYFFEGKTGSNQAPQVSWGDEVALVRISGQEVVTRTIKVTEPDGQTWQYILSGEQRGVSVKRDGDGLLVTLRAIAPVGTHRATVKVVDIYGATAQTDLVFEVYSNTAPGQSAKVIEMPRLFVPINATPAQLLLSDYFADAEGDAVTYSIRTLSDASGSTLTIDGQTLKVASTKVGAGSFEISAKDSQGMTRRGVLQVQGVLSDLVYRAYPIPATTTLTLDIKAPTTSALVEVRNASGTIVLTKTIGAQQVTTGAQSHTVTLNVSPLAPGTYFLNVSVDGKKYTQPFVKQ